MIFKNSLLLLRRTYRQLLFLWFVFFVLIVGCYLFVTNVVNDLLSRSADDLLTTLQTKVVSDLLESEMVLRGASLHINRMVQGGYLADEVQAYIKEFNNYVLADSRRVTGINGIYGVFGAYGGVFINGVDGTVDVKHPHLDRPWYRAAIEAKGGVAVTPPYFNEISGEWVITFSRHLVSGSGRSLAVIGLDLNLSKLRQYFSVTHLAEGGYGLMLDDQLNIVVSPTADITGQPMSVLQSPDIYRIMADINRGENLRGYKTVNNRDGGEPIIVHSRRMENGWHIAILTPIRRYYRDIFDRALYIITLGVTLELLLSLIVLRIAAGKQRADEKERRKSNFLANMSHEIRTPMNAIIGFAELALRENIPPAAYEHIFTIKQAGANLLSIINDILDFSKIESGKLEIIPSDYHFASMVNDVVSIIKMRATYSRLRFVVNIDSNIPNALHGDGMRVRQTLLNVLSNAVKYTDKGFVSLTVSGQITGVDTVVLKVDVADSGKGIRDEDIPKLFKDFVQVDKARNKGIEGTGLGLAITNNILKAMGGTISVKSEYGKGSTFTVSLPQKFTNPEKHALVADGKRDSVLIYERREIYSNSIIHTIENLGVSCKLVASEAELDEAAEDTAYKFLFTAPALYERAKKILVKHKSGARIVLLTEFGDAIADQNATILSMPAYSVTVANVLNGISDNMDYGSKKESMARFIAPEANVLVVDDTGTNLRVAEGLLSPYKMRVTLCKSGPEAIDAVQSEFYDVVFMDHMMPGMDGIEATKRIRNLGGDYRKLPIIALTANAVAGAREMFLSEGLNDFISKPIEIAKLNSVLDKWIPKEKQKSPADTSAGAGYGGSGADAGIVNIKIDGVDVKRGVTLSGGNGTLYLRALAMFYDDGFEKIAEIKRCLEMEDIQLYTTHVHGLKSASASIGANSLSESARALEIAGKEANQTFINEQNPKFLMELETLLRNIGMALDGLRSDGKPCMNANTLNPELVRLKKALDGLDSEGIDQATETLQGYEASADFGGEVKAILQNVLIGEYDEALAQIDELLDEVERQEKLENAESLGS